MPSGKSKSKENTWSERELTDAIQGEKPRRSKDERRQREGNDDRAEKRHSRDKTEGDGDRERERRQRKSERHEKEASLDREEGHKRHSRDDGDRERKHKDRNKEKVTDDEGGSGGSERRKERRRKERSGEEGQEEDGRKHREKGERSKEKSRRKHRDDTEYEMESSRDRKDRDEMGSGRERKERDERKTDKENRRREIDRKGRDERGKEKDERRWERDRDEERHEKEKKEKRRDKENDERKKEKEDRRREKEEDRKDRHRDKSLDNDLRSEGKKSRRKPLQDEDDDENERERRRRKKERKEAKENGKDEDESNTGDKDWRKKDRRDKERSEVDSKDKHRRREDRERRKQKEQDQGDNENQRLRERGKESAQESKKKESKGKLENNGRSLSINSAVEVDEEIQKEDDYAEDNYEDDFEDYEDDFEDADEDDVDEEENGHEQDKGKLLEIFEAINAENDDVRRSPFQQSINDDFREENEKPAAKSLVSPQGRINFFAAKQKHVTEFVASKTRKRAEELKNLIELDVASYDIFDLPPLNEYELYIKSYGQSDSKQAYVQCHDDFIEKEMQTEMIEMCTKWTQYPPDDFKGCGEGDESQGRKDSDENVVTPPFVDSVRLTNFLQQAGQVCLILLEEKNSARKDLMFKERNDLNISDGFIQLASKLAFLEGRRVLDMKFNSVQTHLLLTAHNCGTAAENKDKNSFLRGRGIVCYWNVNEPSQPQKILYCECSPNSCCFSPVKSSLVFAGLEDGSVVVWDIRESSSLHSTINDKDNQWVVRRPTFSTAGVLFNENHLSPVQKILPIAPPIDSAQTLSRSSVLHGEPGGMAFQLASLDESGMVNIWVVIELEKPDEAGSENDLGLAPGGRVKLIKSTSIQVEPPHREIFIGCTIQTSTMQFSALDPNHFYVGTDRGWVMHCTRYGGKPHPKVFRPETETFITVSAIDVSPWNIPIILVGCTDGTLRLHDLRKEHAICTWPESTQGSAIVQLMWSKSRPSFFFVLDANSNLYIWDLLQKDGHPIATESFKRGKLLFFSMSNDYESLGVGLPGRRSELVLNYEGGIIELHRLKEMVTNVQADELDRFASLVDSMI